MAQNFHQLPPSKRFKILNSEQISLPPNASDKNNQNSLPAKKRAQNLKSSSTSACLPAKKRVWVPPAVSPTKSETPSPDSDPLVEEKLQTKEGEASNGVPLKKRVWARRLLSPIKTKTQTQTPDADSKRPNEESQSEVGEKTNLVPAKKRVWMENPLTPALPKAREEVTDLKSVREKVRNNELKEVKEIQGVPAKKRVWAPNPLSAEKQVWMEHPPATRRVLKEVTNLKSVHEKDHRKESEAAKEIPGVETQKWVWDLNLLPAIQEVTEEIENPLPPTLLGIEEEENNENIDRGKGRVKEAKEAKEFHGVATKKRVWAPNPLPQTKTQSQTQRSDSKHVKEKGHVNSREAIQEAPAENRVHAVHPLSPAKTGTRKGKNLKLSVSEEKNQIEYQTKGAKESSPVLEKRQVLVPEPPAKTQMQDQTDPKPVKVNPQNEFQVMDEEDTICGVPLKQVCAVHPLSPAKTQTQDEEKDPESIEGEEIDDGVVCSVCQSTDGEPSDPIVFCDGCDLMVHASCYGNPLFKSIPEGDWFCLACSSKAPQKVKRCCLCPVKEGALKPTVDGKWAHVMCALLVPEVFFLDPEGREGIDCSRVPHKRWQKDCFICGRNKGCAIDCAEGKCKLGFHVSCGLEEGLCIEYREGKGGDIVAGFCTEHTKLWEKQQLTGKFKIVPRDQELEEKPV